MSQYSFFDASFFILEVWKFACPLHFYQPQSRHRPLLYRNKQKIITLLVQDLKEKTWNGNES